MILLNHHAMYICIHSFILACVHASITWIWLERIIINRCDLTLHFYDFLFYNFSIKLFVKKKSFLSRFISIGSLPLGRRQADDITDFRTDLKSNKIIKIIYRRRRFLLHQGFPTFFVSRNILDLKKVSRNKI